MNLRELNRATLARQLLLKRETIPTVDAIERLVGLQAQWPKHPFIGLWTRIEGFQRSDLIALLKKRTVVRATMMRSTIHLASARDYVELRAPLEPALIRSMNAVLKDRVKRLDLKEVVADAKSFFSREPQTFEALRDHFLAKDPDCDERAIGYAVRNLLPLVQAPDDSAWAFPAKATFTLAESWLKTALGAGDPSPRELVRRHLGGYGPSTVADVQAWSGLQGLKDVVASMKKELVSFRDDRGKELFDLPHAPRPPEDIPAPVRYIPEYDNLIVSRADARFVTDAHRPHVFLPALRIASTFLVDGFVAGTWTVERKKKAATLVLAPFAALTKKVRAELETEGEALLRFMEPDAETQEFRIEKPPAA